MLRHSGLAGAVQRCLRQVELDEPMSHRACVCCSCCSLIPRPCAPFCAGKSCFKFKRAPASVWPCHDEHGHRAWCRPQSLGMFAASSLHQTLLQHLECSPILGVQQRGQGAWPHWDRPLEAPLSPNTSEDLRLHVHMEAMPML